MRRVNRVKDDLRLETFGVSLKVCHQLRAFDAVLGAGPVVNFSGGHELTALFHTGDDDGLQISAGCVNCSGITGRAGTQDENRGVNHIRHYSNSKFQRGVCTKALLQDREFEAAAVTMCCGDYTKGPFQIKENSHRSLQLTFGFYRHHRKVLVGGLAFYGHVPSVGG